MISQQLRQLGCRQWARLSLSISQPQNTFVALRIEAPMANKMENVPRSGSLLAQRTLEVGRRLPFQPMQFHPTILARRV